jgi:hypothetical protein
VLEGVVGSNLQSWGENGSRKERTKREVVQKLGGYRSKEPLDGLGPVQIQHIDQEGLVSNNNDVEEFRIGSNGSAGCALIGESEVLSKKTAKV